MRKVILLLTLILVSCSMAVDIVGFAAYAVDQSGYVYYPDTMTREFYHCAHLYSYIGPGNSLKRDINIGMSVKTVFSLAYLDTYSVVCPDTTIFYPSGVYFSFSSGGNLYSFSGITSYRYGPVDEYTVTPITITTSRIRERPEEETSETINVKHSGDQIHLMGNFIATDDVRIYNILGREFIYETCVVGNDAITVKADMDKWPSGAYFINVISGNTEAQTAKFIIVH